MMKFAIDGITCFTSAPLRFSYVLMILVSLPFLFFLVLTLFWAFLPWFSARSRMDQPDPLHCCLRQYESIRARDPG